MLLRSYMTMCHNHNDSDNNRYHARAQFTLPLKDIPQITDNNGKGRMKKLPFVFDLELSPCKEMIRKSTYEDRVRKS